MKNYSIDNTLTYRNAQKRGYVWIDDLYPDHISEDIQQFLTEHGYLLGQASSDLDKELAGLYAPLPKEKK